MKVAVFSTKRYDRDFLERANVHHGHTLTYLEPHLTGATASLAKGFDAACIFVNDHADAQVLEQFAAFGIRLLALRCAGFNQVDLGAAGAHGITVVRVPSYSPHAVAEHALTLMLSLNRRIHRAYNRVRDGNFALNGLLGFDMYGKTVGVIGTGKIGLIMTGILTGLGCKVIAFDPSPAKNLPADASYVDLAELYAQSDIVTLHCPLTADTHHLINGAALAAMKNGVMLINTSRGALIDTRAAIEGLKSGHIGYLGLDVYEEEDELFFDDLSNQVMRDDVFARLLTFPNVLITGHQGFFTREALAAIAETTLANITNYALGRQPLFTVSG
ncbi:2-hydroxyacid dehydrogenase [Parahaliea aestuarii]|uniref:2-hydroxyacid dehydrogenase n=1 Tax=Parahaliea aestuarii TaxID=1852021 RepID=A0A5C9A1C6_9GAMM|nr:2-hydroxyacid dehydrogenase [Parahaliea aestuarii]TXS93580.1 2-hydroxyacid dehydrogenase [Parahaliea aestuarii]